MAICVVHLSDAHFSSEGPNSALDRVEELCGALRSVLDPADECVVVFSGDIASRGKEADYGFAQQFASRLEVCITAHIEKHPHFVIVPGNHDLDYDLPGVDQAIRDLIIGSASPRKPPSQGMLAYCLAPQAPYRGFAQALSASMSADSVLEIATLVERDLAGAHLQFLLLNTTPYSQRERRPSSIWLPMQALDETMGEAQPGAICIAVLHHPYGYFVPENGSEVQLFLENKCDVILTGHAHLPDEYEKRRRSQEQNIYLAGGVLQDPEDPKTSTFNVVRISAGADDFGCQTYSWTGSRYEPITDVYSHRYHRLRQPLLRGFQLAKNWEEWLDEVGTDYRHPRCHDLKLSQLFEYPDLQRLDVRRACTPTGTVHDRDVLGFVQEKKRVMIAGAERAGKTCLAKQLFKDLRSAGLVPLLVGADFRLPHGLDRRDGERIKAAFDGAIQQSYSVKTPDQYWQTKVEERALIVDDYGGLPISIGGRDQLLRWLDDKFGVVVLLARPGIRLTDILDHQSSDTLLWTYEHADILECDSEMRFELAKNWLRAGMDAFDESADRLYGKAIRYCQAIDAVVGQGAIPSLPQFVFMMLQQLEVRGSIDQQTGLYGSLFEFIIRDVVRHAARDHSDLELKLTYLSEFAFHLHIQGRHFVSSTSFEAWHGGYCETYNCRLDPREMMYQFEALGVFRRREATVGFKYRYYYCFFLARYLANNIHEEEIFGKISELCAHLHHEDFAKTLLFLCHLSKNPRILKMLLETAQRHFAAEPEYDLSTSPRVLPAAAIRPAHLELAPSSPERERVEMLRRQDEESRPHGLAELSDEEEPARHDALMDLVNELNSALHSIRICGQVVRNFYGTIKGGTQLEFVRECYGLCLRAMTVLFRCLERDREEMAGMLADILLQRYPRMDTEEMDRRVRRSLQFIALTICYGLVKHTSNSVGLADLEPTFDQILEEGQNHVSLRMLDLSARLDYFDDFPEQAILSLAKDMRRSSVGYEVLRVLAWEHFKLFRSNYRVRQRVCAKLDIHTGQEALPNPHDAKLAGPKGPEET